MTAKRRMQHIVETTRNPLKLDLNNLCEKCTRFRRPDEECLFYNTGCICKHQS